MQTESTHTSPANTVKPWQIAIILLLPCLYFINGYLPWSRGLWVDNDHGFFIPFFTSVIVLHCTGLLLAFYFLRSNNLTLKDIGYTLNAKNTFIFIASYLCLGALVYFFTDAGLQHVKIDPDKLPRLGQFFPRTSAERIFWIFMAFTAGFCEEFIYRGFGISALVLRGVNKSLAVLITAISFTLMHAQSAVSSVSAFSTYLFMGLLFGGIFLWTKKLWIPMLLHMLFDLTAMMAIFKAAGH